MLADTSSSSLSSKHVTSCFCMFHWPSAAAVSIPRLLGLVRPLISSPCYTLLRYTTVSPMLGAVRARYSTAALPGEVQGAAGAAAAAAAAGAGAAGAAGAAAGAAGGVSGGFLPWVKAACTGSANTVFADQVQTRS
jgi:hypothetical protein